MRSVHTSPSSSHAPEVPRAAPLRVIIADEHALFREGLRSALKTRAGITVVAEAGQIDEIMPILDTQPCDILLLDIEMDRDALGDLRALSQRVKVAVLTASEKPEELVAAVRAGASAVVSKHLGITNLVEALKAVSAGHVWLPPSLQACVANQLRRPGEELLTRRERDIVRWVALGLHNAEVAKRMFISEQTVKTHLRSIFRKLGVRDRVALTLHAARVGIIGVHEHPE